MGIFDFFKGPDMQKGLDRFAGEPLAVLLDVRTPGEYAEGRIPGSRNLPLDRLNGEALPREPDTPLFVYCYSGARSAQAAARLRQLGYTDVTDLGGITRYKGKLEH